MPETQQAMGLELRLLGPLEIRRNGEAVALGGPKPRTLLADLLIHLGEAVSVDRLVEDLWPEEAPASAAHAVEVYVSQLRKAVDPERAWLLRTGAGGYAVTLDPELLDLRRFERLLDDGRASLADGYVPRAATVLREALELWRGSALADFTYEPFAQAEIARLEDLRAQALEERIEADLALGHHADVVAELETLVAANPFRERLRAQLMLANYRCGRQADALGAYRAARLTLVEELGIEPGPELRALEAAILRQDDALQAPTAAAPESGARQQRKLVTILFADLVGSVTLGDSVDPETMRHATERYFELTAAALAEHGGTVEKYIGDAVMAAFGLPVAHEDDALRAVRAAVEIRDGLAGLNEALERELGMRLEVRIGVASGEVVAGDALGRTTFATGDAVNVASRLQETAAPGEILLGELTRRLVAHATRLEEAGELRLRGKREPVPTFRLLEVMPAAPAVSRRLDVPFVGRQEELLRLRTAFEAAVAKSALRAVLVLGPAGIGKSRLALELSHELADRATVLDGRCLSYGTGMTFWPVQMVVRAAAGGESRDAILAALDDAADAEAAADRLAAALGSGASPPTDEIVWAFRVFCEGLARRQPLVLILDDLHWADPTFLDLVEQLVGRSADAPILVLCIARDDLLEERRDFLVERQRTETVALDALPPDQTDALADALCGDAALPEASRRRIVEVAEGNPLFLEQLVALAAEEGGLDPRRALPTTIQALMLARLDRLGPGERAVLERAAIVGREFGRSAVTDLLEPGAQPTARRHLESLVRRGFIRTAPSVEAFEDTFRFRHALIQAAAYGATPKADRSRLHERFAEWLESRLGEGASELDALVGYHLEQAYRYRAELGPLDRHARGLAAEAGARLGSAGLRAWKRGDAGVTVNLLGRATSLLPDGEPTRRELLCELGVALQTAGESMRAAEALEEAVNVSLAAGDRRVELRGRIELGYVHLLGYPLERADDLLAAAAEAIPVLETVGDDRSLGRAWLLTGFVHGGVRGQNAEWLDGAERALVHYRRAGWPIGTCLGQIAAALYEGPTAVTDAITRYDELLRDTALDRSAEANVRVFLAGLVAQQGRFAAARELVRSAQTVYEELGQASVSATHCGTMTAEIAFLAGDPVAAAHALGSTCDALREMGDLSNLATRAAGLAEALYAQRRYEEAETWTRTSETHAGRDDLTAQPAWRSVRAKVLARRGELDEAAALAAEAARLARRTDALNACAKVLLDFGEVLRLAGRSPEATTQVQEAVGLFEAKGNEVGAGKARAILMETALA